MNPLVSFLLPTRKRFRHLVAAAESLLATCRNPDSFELLTLFDDDDAGSRMEFQHWAAGRCWRHRELSVPRLGYSGMHEYNNRLCTVARGEWVWLWNDDSRMLTPGWDDLLETRFRDQFVLLSPLNVNNEAYTREHSMFPILPRKWFVITGRLSPYQQSDTYLNAVAQRLGIFRHVPEIRHQHGEIGTVGENRIQDEVTREIHYHNCVPEAEVLRDCELLKPFVT